MIETFFEQLKNDTVDELMSVLMKENLKIPT